MRVTIKELRRIIKEEYAKVLEEGITTGELDNPEVRRALADAAAALSHPSVKDRDLPATLMEIIDHNIRTPITIGGGSKEAFSIAMGNLTTIQNIILGVTPEERAQAAEIWWDAQPEAAPIQKKEQEETP